MNNFIIAAGHTASGSNGCGAVGRIDESKCVREICPLIVKYLEEKGYSAKLLRIDKGNIVNLEDCYTRVNDANNIDKTKRVDLYVEIHLNAGGGTGSEVYVTGLSSLANQYAEKISNSLAKALSIPNRGVKKGNFIVLNRTIMPAVLVECLFVDSEDADKYDPELIAEAIACGLIGAENFNEKLWNMGWNKNNIGWWYCTNNLKKYYYTSQNGWKNIDNEWYIFDDNGYALQNSWHYDNSDGYWYYLNEICKMVKGTKNKHLWLQIDDDFYAFDERGAMYCNCITPDGHKVDESGSIVCCIGNNL
nr:N-acetylmuramoyl-L-alanine amidase [Clostridium chromiireducens]